MVLSDMRRVQFRKDGNLLYDIFHLILCIFNVNNLYGYGLPCPSVNPNILLSKLLSSCCRDIPFVNFAKAAPSYTVLPRVKCFWIDSTANIVAC